MRGAPIHPSEYDGEHLDTDEKLVAEGWAAGLDVWEQVGKGYSEFYLNDDTLGNAQLWSLQEAIRAEERECLAAAGRLLPDGGETDEQWAMSYKLNGEQQPPGHGGHVFGTRKEAERHLRAWRDCYPSLDYTDVRYLRREVVTGPWVEVPDAQG